MCDNSEELSPLPFRRERNLSNRNFNKRNSRRRLSSTSMKRSTLSNRNSDVDFDGDDVATAMERCSSSATMNADSCSTSGVSHARPTLEFQRDDVNVEVSATVTEVEVESEAVTPDPAWFDVRHKVQHFETLRKIKRIFKTERLSLQHLLESRRRGGGGDDNDNMAEQQPVDVAAAEEASEALDATSSFNNEMAAILQKIEGLKQSVSLNDSASEGAISPDTAAHPDVTATVTQKERIYQTYPRNYRAAARPKTEVGVTIERSKTVEEKYQSLYEPKESNDEEFEDDIELRDKSDKCVLPILEELIRTEQAYVENLYKGIENYSGMFRRKDLPIGLRGKKYDLLGNIEQIAEFHRDEFLPMLQRNKRDLKRLFEEFYNYIESDCFYSYVIFTMNKQTSLKLCEIYKNYFKLMQTELDDRLGINSFLVQPIQRMARYPLLLTQFITTFFKNRNIVMKPLIEACCRLERRFRTLLNTTNESEIVNDIVDCNEFNVFYQGKFLKVSEFQVFDHTQRRQYRSKVFIFDKCIIYTEVKGRQLIFHGRYPCEHVGISAKTRSFTLYYERRRQQECDFSADAAQVASWLELIREMVNNFVQEERRKLQERYAHESDYSPRKAPSLSLYRDSNRFSSDSGIGNIWVMPKSEEETPTSNRTTWYADT